MLYKFRFKEYWLLSYWLPIAMIIICFMTTPYALAYPITDYGCVNQCLKFDLKDAVCKDKCTFDTNQKPKVTDWKCVDNCSRENGLFGLCVKQCSTSN